MIADTRHFRSSRPGRPAQYVLSATAGGACTGELPATLRVLPISFFIENYNVDSLAEEVSFQPKT